MTKKAGDPAFFYCLNWCTEYTLRKIYTAIKILHNINRKTKQRGVTRQRGDTQANLEN